MTSWNKGLAKQYLFTLKSQIIVYVQLYFLKKKFHPIQQYSGLYDYLFLTLTILYHAYSSLHDY